MPGPVRVFVSSTFDDLQPYREAVRDAVIGAEMLPAMMEYFVASGERPPLHTCLAKVAAANLLVVIVAQRYGWVPPDQAAGEHKSITWLECEQAVADGKEVLAFLLDEQHSWPEDAREAYRLTAAMQDGTDTDELYREVKRSVARLKDFKAWLNSCGIRATFTNPADLRRCVSDALHDWQRRYSDLASDTRELPRQPADPTIYLRDLLSKTAFIDIRGLQVGQGRAHRFPIEELYITLTTTLTPTGPADAEGGHHRRPDTKTEGELVIGEGPAVELHLALRNDRLVAVGDPGAGKTTFLRRIAHSLCQTTLGDSQDAAQVRLGLADRTFPIFLRLSELVQHIQRHSGRATAPSSDDAPAWLPHYLATASVDNAWGLEAKFFQGQLEGGVCTVLLDGLDEAPDRIMRARISRLIENATNTYRGCRFVVTSRPAAYAGEVILPEFRHARIDPLSDDAVETFLCHWCGELYVEGREAALDHCRELLEALRGRPDIRCMARNPVMLTALAVVHWNERRLPEQRADLYESIIHWLSRSRESRPGRATADQTVVRLQELALAMQDDTEGRKTQVPKRWAAERLAAEIGAGPVSKDTVKVAERFLDEEEIDSGIIVGRGHDVSFWHLTFQEFLAARAIASRLEPDQRRILFSDPNKLYLSDWREVVLLLAGTLHQQGRAKVDGLVSTILDGQDASLGLTDQARCAGLLGSVLRDLKPLDYQISDSRYAGLLHAVTAIFDRERSRSVPIETRVAAADALGQAGDVRIDVNQDDYWIAISAGTFLMGAQSKDPQGPHYDQNARDDEAPVHEVPLDAFRIARYPVTVGQYQQFLADDGYQDPHWWKAGGLGEFKEPEKWEEQLPYPSRPVVGVSWWEAAAYCAWGGYRLPSEAEWERAARGTEGRKYPWGNEAPDETRANYWDTGIRHLTPVGIFPGDMTPDGVVDLGGNVLEWCADWYGRYNVQSIANHSGSEAAVARVIRGGGWGTGARRCRAALRNWDEPLDRLDYLGFRMAAVLFVG